MDAADDTPDGALRTADDSRLATVERDGVRLSYEKRGGPDGEPVLLLEGLGYARWM